MTFTESTGLRLHRLYPKNITQENRFKINGFETSADDFDFGTVDRAGFFSVQMCVIKTVTLRKKYRIPGFLF